MSLSNHYRSEVLLDVETAAGGFQQRKGMRRCLPLTFCFHTGLSQYMALEPAEGRRMFESFYPCPVGNLPVCPACQGKCHKQDFGLKFSFEVRTVSVFQDQTAQDPSAINMFITGLFTHRGSVTRQTFR